VLDPNSTTRDTSPTNAKQGKTMSDNDQLSCITKEQLEKFSAAIPQEVTFSDIAALILSMLEAYDLASDDGVELLEMCADTLSDYVMEYPRATMH
jgi:hypothetical protein